jgi:Mce-associated membrane protein
VAVPPAPDAAPAVTTDHPRSGAPSRPLRLALLCLLVVALLASVGVLVWLLADRRGEADDVQQERDTVRSQTEQFMLRMGTYGPDLLDSKGAMPKYRTRVKQVITPKFATSFDKQAGAAEQLVAQAGVSRVAKVYATGVAAMDSDSATTLVAGTFTDSYRKAGQQEPVPFRIEVTLVRSKGDWLVDDFTPVTGAEG